MTVALSIFFLVALSTMSGVMELDRSYRDVARNLGASRVELFLTVALLAACSTGAPDVDVPPTLRPGPTATAAG